MPSEGKRIPAPRSVTSGLNGETVVLDTAGRVLVFGSAGNVIREWAMPESSVGRPEGVCVLADGRIVVCDTHYHRLVYFSPEGEVLKIIGREGRGAGEFIYPVGIVTDDAENLYVCEYGSNDRIQKFTREGDFLLAFGSFGTDPDQLQRPSGLAWRDGLLYVADAINGRVAVFRDDGAFVGHLGGESLALELPYDIALGEDDTLFIAEYGAGRVTAVGVDGRLRGRFGRTGAGTGEFVTPWGIATAENGRVLIADTGNRRVVEVQF
jgi:sugar lactone lactonase YvrE